MNKINHIAKIELLKNKFNSQKPFKYIVIDNFLSKELSENLYENFPNINSEKWTVGLDENNKPIKYAKDNPFEKKMLAISNPKIFPSSYNEIFKFLNSQKFISFIEKLTGIEGLIKDDTGRYAGIRAMPNESFQQIHSDATVHPETEMEKKLTGILYLNKNWAKKMGGYLEIWDNDMSNCLKEISPIFNRLVLFECTDMSYHGVPNPVKIKNDKDMRKSIIFAYMKKNYQGNNPRKRAKFVARPQDDKSQKMEQLRAERSKYNSKKNHRFM